MNFKNIIELIIRNNELFMERTGADFFTEYQEKQSPVMTLVTCSDSRVQSEAIFDNAFNLIFTIRNIGNQIYSNEGSVDYGVRHLKTPILMILAHTDCGAVKAFQAGYANELGSIKAELDHLIPSLNTEAKNITSSILENLDYQVKVALEKYDDLINDNKLLIVGALYDFKNEFKGGYGNVIIQSLNGVKA